MQLAQIYTLTPTVDLLVRYPRIPPYYLEDLDRDTAMKMYRFPPERAILLINSGKANDAWKRYIHDYHRLIYMYVTDMIFFKDSIQDLHDRGLVLNLSKSSFLLPSITSYRFEKRGYVAIITPSYIGMAIPNLNRSSL